MTLLGRLGTLRLDYGSRLQLRRCDAVGEDPRVSGNARIVNQGRINIGARFRFSSEPVSSHLLAQDGGVIDIGNDVSIGHGSGISARQLVSIGNGSRLGAFVLAMDTDYHVAGNANAAAEIAPLTIGAGVVIGNRVTILRGSLIGDGARVLDGSVVRGEVLPGQVVEGVPARAARSNRASAETDSLELRVLRVAQATFRLAEMPELDDGPEQIAAWDSLGALSFILALEEEFSVVVGEDRISGARSLGDAAAVVASASDHG